MVIENGNRNIRSNTYDLKFIKSEISEIKENMVNVDSIISKDEKLLLKKAREEYHKGETISLEELKNELEL